MSVAGDGEAGVRERGVPAPDAYRAKAMTLRHRIMEDYAVPAELLDKLEEAHWLEHNEETRLEVRALKIGRVAHDVVAETLGRLKQKKTTGGGA